VNLKTMFLQHRKHTASPFPVHSGGKNGDKHGISDVDYRLLAWL
jgi:hypothetical protein